MLYTKLNIKYKITNIKLQISNITLCRYLK